MAGRAKLPTVDTRPSKPRTLVLCFDGTTNIYDDTNTNVVKLFALLKRDNREEQMVYYQPGVGTYAPPGVLLPITLALAKLADQGFAWYLDKHVMGGYEFLMKHYNEGDKICLFGFSRGAYTARALAGMLNKVGLLPPDNVEQIPFAYRMYKRTSDAGFKESRGFKKTFSRTVQIEFLGVWDTVSSVGFLFPRYLPFTASNSIVKTFRHAVSLDEHRAKFKQNLWNGRPPRHAVHRDPERPSPMPSPTPSPMAADTMVLSPIQGRVSPSIFQPSGRPSTPTITVTNTTLPLENQAPPVPPATRKPSRLGIQTDLRNFVSFSPLSPVVEGEKQPQGNRPDSGVDGLGLQNMDAPANDLTNKEHQATKSEVSLASGIASVAGASTKEANSKPANGLKQWWRSKFRKSSWQTSGSEFEAAWDGSRSGETDVLEVWFAGCHSDVGGGADRNDAKHSLSDISLRWMVRQIISSQCGIQFDPNALKDSKLHIPVSSLAFGKTNPGAHYSAPQDTALVEAAREKERSDALAEMHDSLRNPFWWPLELLPLIHSYQDRRGKWHHSITWNLFGPRHARKTLGSDVVRIHRSVQYRMENSTKPYKYRAKIDGDIEWVDDVIH